MPDRNPKSTISIVFIVGATLPSNELQSAEGGRPRVLRRNDRLGSQEVLSGFSWVLMGSQWVLMGSQGVLSEYSDCAFLGSQVVLRQAPPLWQSVGYTLRCVC